MRVIALVFSVLLLSCSSKKEPLSAEKIIEKSIEFHDRNNQWNTIDFTVHIQEPRVGNPYRYSVVSLDNQKNIFELKRNRDHHVSSHKVDKNQVITLLDGKVITDSLLIKKYRLEPKRNHGYHRFYKVLLGLPMSLPNEIKEIGKVEEVTFNSESCYKIPVELKEALFSKNWILYISKKQAKILGLEMVFPKNPNKGERLVFEGEIKLKEMLLPRIRHWRELTNEYSGSDIIIKQLD